jgi:hypothetical protein
LLPLVNCRSPLGECIALLKIATINTQSIY